MPPRAKETRRTHEPDKSVAYHRTLCPTPSPSNGYVQDFAVDFPHPITETAYDSNDLLDPINRFNPALGTNEV